MHLEVDRLRAYLDQELSREESSRIDRHLNECPECRARFQMIAARASAVSGRLDALTPRASEQPAAVPLAYARFTSRSRRTGSIQEVFATMLTRRPVWISLAVLAAIVIAFSFSPVRVWASDLLSLFRVQRVEVITIDPAALEAVMERVEANENAIEAIFKDNVQFEMEGDILQAETFVEAQEFAGFTPRLPAAWEEVQLAVRPAVDARLLIDQPQFQALTDAIGMDLEISPDLDGEEVSVHAPAAVIAAYGCAAADFDQVEPSADCPTLIQLPSPVVNSPEGLEVEAVGEAVLQLFGMSEFEASMISQRIDWTTTLVLPLPQSGEVFYQEVQVDGVTGTLLQQEDEAGSALVWVKDGMLYGLYAPGEVGQIVEIANSLQ